MYEGKSCTHMQIRNSSRHTCKQAYTCGVSRVWCCRLGSSWRDIFITAASWRRVFCSPPGTLADPKGHCKSCIEQHTSNTEELSDGPQLKLQRCPIEYDQLAVDQEQYNSWLSLPVRDPPRLDCWNYILPLSAWTTKKLTNLLCLKKSCSCSACVRLQTCFG